MQDEVHERLVFFFPDMLDKGLRGELLSEFVRG
jgi:hypothetical protein